MTATRCTGVARELQILYKKYTKILKKIEPAGISLQWGVAAFLQWNAPAAPRSFKSVDDSVEWVMSSSVCLALLGKAGAGLERSWILLSLRSSKTCPRRRLPSTEIESDRHGDRPPFGPCFSRFTEKACPACKNEITNQVIVPHFPAFWPFLQKVRFIPQKERVLCLPKPGPKKS